MQDALAGSPAQSTKMEVDKTSPKCACGSSRERRAVGIASRYKIGPQRLDTYR